MRIIIRKIIDFDELTLGNIIVDGFLCSNYDFASSQLAAEKILKGERVHNACTGAIITRKKVVHSIQRLLMENTQNDVETACDSASEIIRSII